LKDVFQMKDDNAETIVPNLAGWEILDEMFHYEGDDLGATYRAGGVTLKIWAPLASKVTASVYDIENASQLIGSIELILGDKGVWSTEITPIELKVTDLRGYFYQYEVTNNGVTRAVLDPYAKSMAICRIDTAGRPGSDRDLIGKAAIVELSESNPDDFNYACIKGYEKREDAIIWEIHIRDFTSDPSIEKDLNARWGSFNAFKDKLHYIQSLGVTHVQLLPVMAWYFGDEAIMGERELQYSAIDNEYNWGYDPHHYFSPDGAYSEDPTDPELRIKELKGLIHAIHEAGMGVILDVIYTHMAKVDFLNDIVPNYYAWQDAKGEFIGGFGNNLATNRKMAKKLMVDSVKYWFAEYKIDGMRWDMMGDATYEAVQEAFDAAAQLNPKALFIGEGWRTFQGDVSDPQLAGKGADQDWMDKTDSVGVFSDEIRNELKSGYGLEGEPRFLTGGARDISIIFNNIKAQPSNIPADSPGDIVQYIEAHDNLTLYDVIAQSIKKDPSIPMNDLEIHRRIRLGNTLILTSQGTAFLHAGQEYGRTKQWKAKGIPEHKYNAFADKAGNVFGYFVHDSYDSSDAINMFDWSKATDTLQYPVNHVTREYTAGLIALRKSTNAFRLGSQELINKNVTLIKAPEMKACDLVIGYVSESTDGTGSYYVFVNADSRRRTLTLQTDLTTGRILADQDAAGIVELSKRLGFKLTAKYITLDALTAVIIHMADY
jgi:pullulanase